MSLYDQIYDVSPRRETKADIVDYYQGAYPRNWQKHLTEGPLWQISGVKSHHNLARRFNAGTKGGENRLARPGSRKEQEQYRELGDIIPPKPAAGYHIEGVIWILYSKECVDRTINEDVEGEQALELFNMAMAHKAEKAFANIYNNRPIEDEKYKPCSDNEWDVEVTAIEE